MAATRTSRILVVEESSAQGGGFAPVLKAEGYEVFAASGAKQALDVLRTAGPHLVLVDVRLPGEIGAELCRRIKTEAGAAETSIMLLADSIRPPDVVRGLQAGVDGCISRDWPRGEMLTQIRMVLRQAASPQPPITRRLRIPVHGREFDVAGSHEQFAGALSSVLTNLSALEDRLAQETGRREQIERDYRQLQAEHRSLVENLPVSLVRKDLEGRFTLVNKPACEDLGREPGEILGKTDFDLYPQNQAEKYRADDLRVIETGQVFEDVEDRETSSGEKRYARVLKAPVTGADDRIIGVQAVFWDVTDRKRTENELKSSEANKRAIFETALDCMVISDQEGKIIEFNRAAERTFGYRRSEAVGQDMDKLLFAPQSQSRSRENIERYASTREEGSLLGKRLEVPLIRKNGEQFIAEIAMQPIPMHGTVHFATVLHDITNRKKIEAELQKAMQAAETANQAKSEFLANMSHEIRTPMNAVIGLTELLLDTKLDSSQRDYIRMVHDSGESLLSLINDILDFSKIEAGRMALECVCFSPRETLGDTMKSLAIRAHGKGLELACRIAPEVPEALIGDPTRLRQVVVNLVGNAIKFTEEGEVVLDVQREPDADDETTLRFSISDTGIGIPRSQLNKVFKAFEQADTSTTRRFGGTGLGLAICSKLVGLMGGRIGVESEVGKGSTFYFTAHFELAEGGLPQPVLKQPEKIQGMRALIVDDNAKNRLILEEMLTVRGMRPIVVPGATEAIRLLREAAAAGRPFPLVLTDVNMPDIDGFTLAEWIRQDEDLRDAVVMVLTSGDRLGDRDRCEKLGIAAHLMKPVKQSELIDSIVLAFGQAGAEKFGAPPDPAETGAEISPLRILLAEDAVPNQVLAVAVLEKWKHTVVVANNGKEAIERLRSEPFDLVLMDVQMPEMDGLEATAVIRRLERAEKLTVQPAARTPIIAMTAHAMKGDKERCLEAGMDGYVSKPVRVKQLYEAIAEFFSTSDQRAPVEKKERVGEAADRADLIDWSVALESVQGDTEILQDVARAFLDERIKQQEGLSEAIAKGDARQLKRTAHLIKGVMMTFGADEAIAFAQQLESLGQSGDLDGAPELAESLCQTLEGVAGSLATFCNDPQHVVGSRA